MFEVKHAGSPLAIWSCWEKTFVELLCTINQIYKCSVNIRVRATFIKYLAQNVWTKSTQKHSTEKILTKFVIVASLVLILLMELMEKNKLFIKPWKGLIAKLNPKMLTCPKTHISKSVYCWNGATHSRDKYHIIKWCVHGSRSVICCII